MFESFYFSQQFCNEFDIKDLRQRDIKELQERMLQHVIVRPGPQVTLGAGLISCSFAICLEMSTFLFPEERIPHLHLQ